MEIYSIVLKVDYISMFSTAAVSVIKVQTIFDKSPVYYISVLEQVAIALKLSTPISHYRARQIVQSLSSSPRFEVLSDLGLQCLSKPHAIGYIFLKIPNVLFIIFVNVFHNTVFIVTTLNKQIVEMHIV